LECRPGDVVEVFHNLSWKVAIVSKAFGWDCFLVRLVGSFSEFEASKAEIRVRHSWQNDEWVVIGKENLNLSKKEYAAEVHRLELQAYYCTIEALHASGPLTWEKETMVTNLRPKLILGVPPSLGMGLRSESALISLLYNFGLSVDILSEAINDFFSFGGHGKDDERCEDELSWNGSDGEPDPSALNCLPGELREKIIESLETKTKFHNLYESMNNLSTTDALKLYNDDLSKRRVRDGKQNSGGSVLDSYRQQLRSLVLESPAI
nr:hypothetical protein [Tanacetum cinerariifolium]